MTLIRNGYTHPYTTSFGLVLATGEIADINVTGGQEQDAIDIGRLIVMDPDYVPPAHPMPALDGRWREPVSTVLDLPAGGNADGDVRLVRNLLTPYAWNGVGGAWEPIAGGFDSGALMFGQPDGALVTSLPWRAPNVGHFAFASVTVVSAVSVDVDLVDVKLNGVTFVTLSLASGETTSTVSIDLDVSTGDRISVTRLASDGGACQVQIDRGS